MNLPHSGYLKC